MCRHLAYIGPPVALQSLLFDAPHALVRQAENPKLQTAGPDNPDGWGVGWSFAGDSHGEHQRYRSATKMWEDTSFDVNERATVLLAAARYATPGSVIEIDNVAPFAADHWLFSLNGFVSDFRGAFGAELRAQVTERRTAGIEGDTDSEVVFALILDRMDAGATPAAAMTDVAQLVRARSNGPLNLLMTDGSDIVATALDASLFLNTDGALTVISEPLDDGPGWVPVDNGSVVENDRVTPIGGLP